MHNCQIPSEGFTLRPESKTSEGDERHQKFSRNFLLITADIPPPPPQIFPVSSGETWASFGAAWTGQGTRHKISWKWWKKKPLSLAMYLPLNRKLQPLTSTSACRTRRRAEEPPLFFPHLKLLTSGHFGFLDYLCFSTDKVFNCSYP